MSNSIASFLAQIGSPTSSFGSFGSYGHRRDRDDDRDSGLSDFFQSFGEGMMQSAIQQMRALDKTGTGTPVIGADGEGVEAFAQNYLHRSTLEMMTSLSGQDDENWPGSLWGSNDNIFGAMPGLEAFQGLGNFPGLESFPGLGAYPGLGSFPGLESFPGLGAYQNTGLAAQLGGTNYLIEGALRTIAEGLGKPLDEVRAEYASGFSATA